MIIKMRSITSVTSTQQPAVRSWLRKRGKSHFIGFDDEDRKELMKYFAQMDEDGKGSIGFKELEEPLIALGLAESRR